METDWTHKKHILHAFLQSDLKVETGPQTVGGKNENNLIFAQSSDTGNTY